jgi:hypothetical protein
MKNWTFPFTGGFRCEISDVYFEITTRETCEFLGELKKIPENIDVIVADESERLSSIPIDDLNPSAEDIFLFVTIVNSCFTF